MDGLLVIKLFIIIPSMHNRCFWHTFDLDVFDKAVMEVKPSRPSADNLNPNSSSATTMS
jgi:hypothetical protein